ncbi:NAD-P-binding protein [Peniophora sp. CONT]|nr:NAD-P-binding protein [Peniophora sp. CONT]
MSIWDDVIGMDEDLAPLGITEQHDIYPYIDPKSDFTSQSYAGKVVLVTGASRGIGSETATFFAKAGASVVLIARKQLTLDESKAAILKEKPDAQILTFPADVTDSAKAKEAISATVEKFGRLDVVVANAGVFRNTNGKGFAEADADSWWNVIEVNFRGVYNYLHYAVPELKKTRGVFLATTSRIAVFRLRTGSDYAISKLAVNRLIEFAVVENPEIKAFAVHPGVVETEMNRGSGTELPAADKVGLPAAVYLHLAAGKADYLSGRYLSVNWDLEEVEKKFKGKIVADNALTSKLALPA